MHPKKKIGMIYGVALLLALIFGGRWACNSFVVFLSRGRCDTVSELLQKAYSE